MPVEIVPYHPDHAKYFKDLNLEWLDKYFYVEPFDREVLKHPKKYIIDRGGYIFFAIDHKEIVGTVALLKHQKDIFELTKMAVPPKHQGKKIGQLLLNYCMDFGNRNHFSKLILYSHTKLENAIYLYKKYGFKEIALETDNPYTRSNIKMQFLFDQ